MSEGLGHAIRSVADAVAGESFLVLLGDYVVPAKDICDKMLEVSRAHGGASVIAVAPCEPDQVDRYGVIAGDFVGTLEGYEGAGETEGVGSKAIELMPADMSESGSIAVDTVAGATITSTAYRGCVETAFEAFELVKEAQQ